MCLHSIYSRYFSVLYSVSKCPNLETPQYLKPFHRIWPSRKKCNFTRFQMVALFYWQTKTLPNRWYRVGFSLLKNRLFTMGSFCFVASSPSNNCFTVLCSFVLVLRWSSCLYFWSTEVAGMHCPPSLCFLWCWGSTQSFVLDRQVVCQLSYTLAKLFSFSPIAWD